VYAIPNRVKELSSGKKRLGVNYPALAAIMGELTSRVSVTRFYLEEQWSRPKQDSGATFTFGQTYGDCRSAVAGGLTANGKSPEEIDDLLVFISGLRWKNSMGLDNDKTKAIDMATSLFPACASAWRLISKHTSAAEASLLALYGASCEGLKLPASGLVVKPANPPILTCASSLIDYINPPKGRTKKHDALEYL
jgi:hypothetical protein